MWERIKDLIIKSLLCGLTSIKKEIGLGSKKELKSSYNCYKMFGYDILLDSCLNPQLIEINSRPAALSDQLDAFVNRPMVSLGVSCDLHARRLTIRGLHEIFR